MTTKTLLGDVPRLYQNVRPFLSTLPWNDVRNADTCAWLIAGCLESRICSIPAWVSGRISKAQFAQSPLSCAHVTTSVRLTRRLDLTAVSLRRSGLQLDRETPC